jgi:hypothetical protein
VVIPRVDRTTGWSAPALSLYLMIRPPARLAAARQEDCDRERAAVSCAVGGEVPCQDEVGVVPRRVDDVGRVAAWAEAGDRSFWKSRLRNR